jgi:hypothetical protein
LDDAIAAADAADFGDRRRIADATFKNSPRHVLCA